MFVLAIIIAFKCNLLVIDEPVNHAEISDDQYTMILGQASKEAKADIFSVMDRKHR
jgi:hypothetical protein